MVIQAQKQKPCKHHAPLLHHPWFADSQEGMTLHRYFDDQFIQRFVQEAASNRLIATMQQEWYHKDKFGYSDRPTLRLPMHQAFYVTCCEISCNTMGQPAFDPKRILSAGFVIRRGTGTDNSSKQQCWMIKDGQALGWQDARIPTQEPDDYRRFINHGLVHPQYPEPSYSGEEYYPLHTLMVKTSQPNASMRSRTLLWGYLPLGGSYRMTTTTTQVKAEDLDAVRSELEWPFGERNASIWRNQDTRPVLDGYATPAFYQLLDLLINRYQIFDTVLADNAELHQQLSAIYFYPTLIPQQSASFDRYAPPPESSKTENLLNWLKDNRDNLLKWLNNIKTEKSTTNNSRLPATNGQTVNHHMDLYLTQQQADRLRDTLLLRYGNAIQTGSNGLAMPRFGQGKDETFFVVPFIRWQDECGCEQIHWGARGSIVFRVVSPFDPEVQRPRAIILPDLADIKRGSAKGITLMLPKSLADVVLKIKPDMKMESGGPGNSLGLCWNFSFNIPIITICAFILLMIVINLLNLIFFWLPWAFLAIPRLCGKLLSKN